MGIIMVLLAPGVILLIAVFADRQRQVSRRDSDGDAGVFMSATSPLFPDNTIPVTHPETWNDRDERLGTAGNDGCTPDSSESGDAGSDSSGGCDSGGDSGSSGGSE